jgi:DedD protein
MLTSRSGSAGHPAPPPPQSIEAVRRRARHRLIGAAVLVLVGVLGFSLLFDTQPRPIAVDVPIEIPSRNVPKGDTVAAAAGKPSSAVSTPESLAASEEVVKPTPAAPASDRSPAAAQKPADPPTAKPTDVPAKPAAPNPSADDKSAAAKPVADKPVAAKPAPPAPPPPKTQTGNERIVVQVGAFAEVERAREARLKLERAGLKTYTHVAETPQGRRIRVRMGPFATRAEADKAAERAKALGLPAALLWL